MLGNIHVFRLIRVGSVTREAPEPENENIIATNPRLPSIIDGLLVIFTWWAL